MNEQSNTEIARRGYEKFSSGDIEGLLGLLTDDVKWTVPEIENAEFSGARSGTDAVRQFFRQLVEGEEITEFVPAEFIAQGDRVVVLGRSTATARATGRTYSTDWVHVFTIKDGKITAFHEFFDNAAATRAFQQAAAA